jgi:hypothetical protein
MLGTGSKKPDEVAMLDIECLTSLHVKYSFSSIYEDMAVDLCVIHPGVPPRTEIATLKLRHNEANAYI